MSIHLIEPFNLLVDDKAAIDLEWMIQEDSLRLHKPNSCLLCQNHVQTIISPI